MHRQAWGSALLAHCSSLKWLSLHCLRPTAHPNQPCLILLVCGWPQASSMADWGARRLRILKIYTVLSPDTLAVLCQGFDSTLEISWCCRPELMDAICNSHCDLCHAVTQDRGAPSSAFMEKSPEVGLACPCAQPLASCQECLADKISKFLKNVYANAACQVPVNATHALICAGLLHSCLQIQDIEPFLTCGPCTRT